MASRLDKLYARARLPVQNAMVSAFGVQWYWRRLVDPAQAAGFLARTYYTAEQWRSYQTTIFASCSYSRRRAFRYYRDAWRGLGLDAARIARFELEDLAELPILEKEAPRTSPSAPLRRRAVAAGRDGVSDERLDRDSGARLRDQAEFRRCSRSARPAAVARQASVPVAARDVQRPGLVVPEAESTGPFHRFNRVERQVYFSAFHLSPKNAAA